MSHALLLEIGTEEIPARFMPEALASLGRLAEERLTAHGLPHGSARAMGTPRRLAVVVQEVADGTSEQVKEFLGPALEQARDKEGRWTPAALGFARSHGVTPEALGTKKTERGERLCAVQREPGQPAELILPHWAGEVVKGLTFPRSMVWEETRFSFARPVRWLLLLHGSKCLTFRLADVRSGSVSHGLLLEGNPAIPILAAEEYEKTLHRHGIMSDPLERRHAVDLEIRQVTRAVRGWVPVERHMDLLEEVVHLVEKPVGVLGRFDEKFLSLPTEVLVTSMKRHQKFFPVFDGPSRLANLLPCFVGMRNGSEVNADEVREGYERVLSARLADAAFFYEHDLRRRLEDLVPGLSGIVFLKGQTLLQKTEQVKRLVEQLADLWRLDVDVKSAAVRIAHLGKADLLTAMVGEFPELQGIMGRLYATAGGEPPLVADGVEQHYWPLSSEGPLPRSLEASLVSFADKLDTLARNFLAGNVPSGSADPYGLRRAAVGLLRLLIQRGWRIHLMEFLDLAFYGVPVRQATDRAHAERSLVDFLIQRWCALKEASGFRFDEVRAVAAHLSDVVDAEARLQALQAARSHPHFPALTAAFKRARNILLQAEKKGIPVPPFAEGWPEELPEASENSLMEKLKDVEALSAALAPRLRYGEILTVLMDLKEPLDAFFTQVMVMSDDEGLRSRRLHLMGNMTSLFKRVGDFSQIQDIPN